MIARVWHGYTTPGHADAYESMLKPELLPGISKVKGYRGSYLLRRAIGDEVEFITIMFWDSIDAIRAVTRGSLSKGLGRLVQPRMPGGSSRARKRQVAMGLLGS